jgi:glutamate-1-semialdehyde 2,1-aminomutase
VIKKQKPAIAKAGPAAVADPTGRDRDTSGAGRLSAEDRYRAGRERSLRLWERACEVLPNGVSGAAKFYAPYPLFIRSARGSRIVDVDGNEYVDLLMGAGPMLLGHGHPVVLDAVRTQLELMTNPMLPTELSLQLAERIRAHMPYLERMRFVNTGSEATRSAVRVARAVTARPLIAKCEGAFHGSDDILLVSGHSRLASGSDRRPRAVADYSGLAPNIERSVLVLPFNDPEAAVELILEHAHELAAVIVEPVAFSSGGGVPATRAFASALREVTSRHGILLIFDEVLCAYRMGLAGAPAYLDVVPDLAAIGKAIGGGMALAAFGGRAELMEAALGPEAGEREIFQSGTFTENPLSAAAGMAVLDVLENEPALERADEAGRLLRAGLTAELQAHGVQAVVTGVASILQVHIGAERVENRRDVIRADVEETRRFLLGMVARGVLWPPIHPAVTSAAHTLEDVERAIATARTVLRGETLPP